MFGLLKTRSIENLPESMQTNEDLLEESLNYIRSIDPESRNPEIFNLSREHKIYIDEVFTFSP
jgi:hypothetical protein